MPRAKKDDSIVDIEVLDASRLSLYDRKTKVYAGRFPLSFKDAIEGNHGGTKNANPSPRYGNGVGLSDPYSAKDKAYFEDIVMADGTARDALMMRVKGVLGKRLQTKTEPRKYFATEELRKQALESIVKNSEYNDLLAEINGIDSTCKLQHHLQGAQFQKYFFGRAAIGVKVKEGLPVELRPFSSRNLGTVYVDEKSWALKGVEYHDMLINDGQGKAKFWPAEDMLYFTHMDYNVRPDSLYHGISIAKAMIGPSVAKRIIYDEDLPETAKSMWAAKYILPVPGVTSASKLQELSNAIDPAKVNIVNADIGQPIMIPASDNLDKLTAAAEFCDKMIIRASGTPMPLIPGFEDITNRATMDTIAQAWKETTLEFERSALSMQLEAQWYETILAELTQTNVEELEYKVCIAYQDLVFDTMKEKAEAIKLLDEAGVPLSLEAKAEMLGLDNYLEDMQEAEEEMKKEEQQMMKERAEMMGTNDQMIESQPKKKLPFQ